MQEEIKTHSETTRVHIHREMAMRSSNKKGGHLQAKEKDFMKNKTCRHLDLVLLAFRTVRK